MGCQLLIACTVELRDSPHLSSLTPLIPIAEREKGRQDPEYKCPHTVMGQLGVGGRRKEHSEQSSPSP